MKFIKMLFKLILFLCGVVLFIQNSIFITYKIALKFNLFGTEWSSEPIPLYIYLLSAFALGSIASFLYLLGEKLRLSSEVKSYKSQIAKLEGELASLRPEEEEEEEETEEQG